MKNETNLTSALTASWKLNQRITIYLIEKLPAEVWRMRVPGYSLKTVRMIGGHLHNTRCMWIQKAGRKFGLEPPEHVDRYHVSQIDLIRALAFSSKTILTLLEKAIKRGGSLSGFSLGAVHFLSYLVAHEVHHRGQIIMACRQLGHKLPEEVTYGVWKWSKRAKEI